ncbi:MAG: protein-L-isoaspartate O-methyltransferase family protein [Methylovirgula sp.]
MALQADESEATFAALRLTMVECQIRTFSVTDHAVIAQFLAIPREKFVPAAVRGLAYSDNALKITDAKPGEAERRLLPPLILARLIQEAEIKPGDNVLDVAPGTGYSTAILAGLTQNVTALESDPGLQAATKANLAAAGLGAIPVLGGPLRDGVASAAPFDVIFVNGAVEDHLDQLFAQLRDCGRLVTLSRVANSVDRLACRAVAFEKNSGEISTRTLFDASAPLLPEFGKDPAFVF